MKNRIFVLVKKPGRDAKIRAVNNTLDALQSLVGGRVETVTVTDDTVIICNEEGRLLGLEPNCRLFGVDYVGPIVIAGREEDALSSATLYMMLIVDKAIEPFGGELRP